MRIRGQDNEDTADVLRRERDLGFIDALADSRKPSTIIWLGRQLRVIELKPQSSKQTKNKRDYIDMTLLI